MQRDEYIRKLSSHVLDKNISVYDYYYDLAKRIRLAENSNFSEWEISCPFLTGEDYTKLLFSKDPEICDYFAAAMEKVYNFNQVTALVPVENKLVTIPQENNKEEVEETKEVEEETVKVDESKEELSKQDLEAVVNESMDSMELEPEGLKRSELESAINDSMDSMELKPEGLNRNDLESTINESMDSLNNNTDELDRDSLSNLVNETFDSLEDEVVKIGEDDEVLSREDIKEVVDESFSKLGKLGVILTAISDKISILLNGFAVVREKEDKKADLYYHDATTGTLKDKKTVENSNLESGYYVNYQEYVDNMLDSILEQYPTASKIEFINEEGQEYTLDQLLDGVFVVLHEAGAIRFGNEIANADINTYKDLKELNVDGTAKFNGNELRKGMYVRRDMLNKVFSKYKAKVTLEEKETVEEETIGKSK